MTDFFFLSLQVANLSALLNIFNLCLVLSTDLFRYPPSRDVWLHSVLFSVNKAAEHSSIFCFLTPVVLPTEYRLSTFSPKSLASLAHSWQCHSAKAPSTMELSPSTHLFASVVLSPFAMLGMTLHHTMTQSKGRFATRSRCSQN